MMKSAATRYGILSLFIVGAFFILFSTNKSMPFSATVSHAYPAPNEEIISPRPNLASALYKQYLPALPDTARQASPPLATRSRYIWRSNYLDRTNNLGRFAAERHPNGIVILDFGAPTLRNGVQGTTLLDNVTFASLPNIELATKRFIEGFCNYETLPASSSLTLAIGTNNKGSNTTRSHGEQWATMVNNVATWFSNYTVSCRSRIIIAGATNIELNFGPPNQTIAWVEGYTSLATRNLYNFGACENCPRASCPNCIPDNGWTLENVWKVSWGISRVFPVPQIYASSGVNADQWYRMSLYSISRNNGTGNRIVFAGSMTQEQACIDQNQPSPDCDNKNQGPDTGWRQLNDAIQADPQTRLSLPIRWSTDISWRN